jgi:hypothetical protein
MGSWGSTVVPSLFGAGGFCAITGDNVRAMDKTEGSTNDDAHFMGDIAARGLPF